MPHWFADNIGKKESFLFTSASPDCRIVRLIQLNVVTGNLGSRCLISLPVYLHDRVRYGLCDESPFPSILATQIARRTVFHKDN